MLCMLSASVQSLAQQSFKDLLKMKTEKQLHEIIDSSPAITGFCVIDLTSGESFGINENLIFPTASAIKVAIALAEAFECSVNELPLSMVLSWYEQKAVCILLTLLHLGIKNILLGPSLPAFISPNVLNFLVGNYNIAPITTPEEDLKKLLG